MHDLSSGEPGAPHTGDMALHLPRQLRALFRTAEPVLVLPTPIPVLREIALRAGIEHRALVLVTGPESEELARTAEALGKEVLRLAVPPGRGVEPIQLERFVAEPEVDSVVLVHAEASLGVQSPLAELARVVRRHPEVHLVVDASHSLGATPVETDAWGLDLVLAGSEGALALPAGLSFVSASPRLLARARGLGGRGRQLDLVTHHEAQVRGDALLPLAPRQREQLALQLDRILDGEGLESRWDRHATLAEVVRSWAEEQEGVRLLAEGTHRAMGQSCLVLEGERSAKDLSTRLAAVGWDRATSSASDRHLSISHMGEVTGEQLQQFLLALAVELANRRPVA